ncbi:MAG: RNA polymerase sigma factor RpoH [Legionellales bacterium]|nr:RNA polymerase sigma factor RpoH [Legionellales bacterium]
MANELQLRHMGLVPVGSAEAYIHAVNQIPLLTAEEESELARRYQQDGDLEAAKKLVLSQLRYVARIAHGYLGYGLPVMDLIQEGNIGLMKAVKRFDPTMGVRLVSFAVHWIKSEMHEFIIRNWRIVKIATTKAQRKLFFNLRSAKKRLGWMTNDEISSLAKDLNVSTQDVLQMEARLNNADVALEGGGEEDDDQGGNGSTHFAPIHYLEDKHADPLQQLLEDDWSEQAKEKLLTAIESLDDRSRHIINVRWLGEEKATLQDLAAEYNISLERVRQIEKNAMNKVKGLLINWA